MKKIIVIILFFCGTYATAETYDLSTIKISLTDLTIENGHYEIEDLSNRKCIDVFNDSNTILHMTITQFPHIVFSGYNTQSKRLFRIYPDTIMLPNKITFDSKNSCLIINNLKIGEVVSIAVASKGNVGTQFINDNYYTSFTNCAPLDTNARGIATPLPSKEESDSIFTIAVYALDSSIMIESTAGFYLYSVTINRIYDGVCGDNLTWRLGVDSTLSINGNGSMYNYNNTPDAPWYQYGNGIKKLCLPSMLTSLGDHAFTNWPNLVAITSRALQPPICGLNTFDSIDTSIPIYVPIGSAELYQNAEGWKEFTNIQATLLIEVEDVTESSANFEWHKVDSANYYSLMVTDSAEFSRTYIIDSVGNILNNNATTPRKIVMKIDSVGKSTETLTINITGLQPATTYTYKVSAYTCKSPLPSSPSIVDLPDPIYSSVGEFTTLSRPPLPCDISNDNDVHKLISNGVPYNLLGQPVGKTYKGVIIKDGNKYLQ